jgi:hypothetical protein
MDELGGENSIWISNWNYAGFPLFLGFILAPLMIASPLLLFYTGWPHDRNGQPLDWPIVGILVLMFVGGGAVLIYNALTSPVIWICLGETLRYRTTLEIREREWSAVKSIRFRLEESQMPTRLPGLGIPLGVHRIFVLWLDDGSELRARVSDKQAAQIRRFLATRLAETMLQGV